MSTNKLRGDAVAVAKVYTATPASVTVGNIFSVTINGKVVSFTATVATAANVIAGIVSAVNSSQIPEFTRIVAANGTTVVTFTSRTPGEDFTITTGTATGSGSGGCTFVSSVTTSNSGPNVWTLASNWTAGTSPASTEDVYVDGSADLLYGINTTGVTLASLNFLDTYVGNVGLPPYGTALNSATKFYQYLPTYLSILSDVVNVGLAVGDGSGSGSSRTKLNLGNHTTTINVYRTGQPADAGLPALYVAGHASATYTLNVTQGWVGLALEPGQVCICDVVRIGYREQPASDVNLWLGDGCSVGSIEQSGGNLVLAGEATSLTMIEGAARVTGSLGSLVAEGGKVYHEGTFTLSTVTVGGGAVLDFSRVSQPMTVTDCTLQAGATLLDPNKRVTFTNGIVLDHCKLSEVTLDLGDNRTIEVS